MVKEGLVIHKYSRSDTKLMWNIYLSFCQEIHRQLAGRSNERLARETCPGLMPAVPPPGYTRQPSRIKKIHVIDEERAFFGRSEHLGYLEPRSKHPDSNGRSYIYRFQSWKNKPHPCSAIHKMLRNPFYVERFVLMVRIIQAHTSHY